MYRRNLYLFGSLRKLQIRIILEFPELAPFPLRPVVLVSYLDVSTSWFFCSWKSAPIRQSFIPVPRVEPLLCVSARGWGGGGRGGGGGGGGNGRVSACPHGACRGQ